MKSFDKIGDIIVKLKSEVPQAKLDQHLPAIPIRADHLLKKQVTAYSASDRKRALLNPATRLAIELDEVKFMPMFSRQYKVLQDSDSPVLDLIEYDIMKPFMLFVNGYFIPLEYIHLVGSYGKYYLIVWGDEYPNFEVFKKVRVMRNANLFILPSHVVYSIDTPNPNLVPMFAFDIENRYTEYPNWVHCYYHPINNKLTIDRYMDIVDKSVLICDMDSGSFKYFNENFFIFTKEGLFVPDASAHCLGGYVRFDIPGHDPADDNNYIPISDTYRSVFIANNEGITPTVDNISKLNWAVAQHDVRNVLRIPDVIASQGDKAYALDLEKEFNFSMSTRLLYPVNRENAIKYILSYRTDLWYELYEYELNFFTLSVDYRWIDEHRDEDGYLNISRRSSLGTDYYIIAMVDGELYEYYKHHYYRANRFICPVTNMENAKSIELMFFKRIKEYDFETTFNIDDPYLPLHEFYYTDDTKIFCNVTSDKYFAYPTNGKQHFPVAYHFDVDEEGKRKVVFEDPFYYGKKVTVAPNTTFRYFGFVVDREESKYYKLNMSKWFHSCWNYDRYMVFQNGRRLTNDQYRLTIPCRTTTPFYEFEIYLATPLTYMDRLDVFYLPHDIRDLDVDVQMDAKGCMTFEKKDLEYILGSRLYTFWVNGRKIPISWMQDVDSRTIQIKKDLESIKHLKITRMGKGNTELEPLYQAQEADSIWDEMIAKVKEPYRGNLLSYTQPAIMSDGEEDAYLNAVPIISIMWELIREHYMANPAVDLTGPFIYDYLDQDKTAIAAYEPGETGKDPEGHTVLDAANANRTDNLNVERYSP